MAANPDTRPLGEQPRPRHEILSPFNGFSYIELRFPSEKMAAMYQLWLDSGRAHEAFGEWFDEQDIE